jgi:predicted ATPase
VTNAEPAVGQYFARLAKLVDPKKQTWNFPEARDVLDLARIHEIVKRWTATALEHERVDRNKDRFLMTVNNMLIQKSMSIGKTNDFVVHTDQGNTIEIQQLSSGEKQLLIILGEALLRDQEPWVYIADEPELSLHVNWQEQLVRNLLAVNPKAQILFATHSPDIVSTFGNRVFDMQDVLR